MPKQTKTTNSITMKNFHEYVINNDNLIHIETGEVVHNVNMILDYDSLYKQINKAELDSNKTQVFYKNNWKYNHRFTKLYQVNVKELLDLSLIEKTLLFTLICLIKKSSNQVVYNNKTPSNSDLCKLSKLSKDSVLKAMKSLEKKNVIYKTNNRKDRNIFVNPNYFFNGNNLIKEVLKMFDK